MSVPNENNCRIETDRVKGSNNHRISRNKLYSLPVCINRILFFALHHKNRGGKKSLPQSAVCALSQRANKVLCLLCSAGEWVRESEWERRCDYRAAKWVSVSLKHTHTHTRIHTQGPSIGDWKMRLTLKRQGTRFARASRGVLPLQRW